MEAPKFLTNLNRAVRKWLPTQPLSPRCPLISITIYGFSPFLPRNGRESSKSEKRQLPKNANSKCPMDGRFSSFLPEIMEVTKMGVSPRVVAFDLEHIIFHWTMIMGEWVATCMAYMYDNFMIHVRIPTHGAFGRTDRTDPSWNDKNRHKNPFGWIFCDLFPRLMSEIKSSPFQHMGFKNSVFSLENWPHICFSFLVATNVME